MTSSGSMSRRLDGQGQGQDINREKEAENQIGQHMRSGIFSILK